MFRSVLIPLDQSSFAEQALPLAVGIAQRAGARLHLTEVHGLYAFDEPHADWAPYEPDQDAEYRQREQLYLDATARWITAAGPLPVTTSVLAGSTVLSETVADAILTRARDCEADLIVMASHDHGSLGRCAFGSVALELVRRSGIPVLRVPAHDPVPERPAELEVEQVLIPLDGSSPAEQVLEPALELARLMEARCTLLQIVPADDTSGKDAKHAGEYLARIARAARRQGLEVRTRVVEARDAAAAIVGQAGEAGTVIAMATHGRGGLKRLMLGSVTERVLRGTPVPVLAFHPTGPLKLKSASVELGR